MADSICYCSTPDILQRNNQGTFKAALPRGVNWENGTVLDVCFLNGTSGLRGAVEHHIKTWEEHGNIRFRMSTSAKAPVRVSFDSTGLTAPNQFDALLGKTCLNGNPAMSTVNLGFVPGTPESEIRRLILHEFGHVLGLIHEHQSPAGGIQFKPNVYQWFKDNAGWDASVVRSQVLSRFSQSEMLNSTSFDPRSIMCYYFPAEVAEPPTFLNTILSPTDILFIGQVYPKDGPASPAPAPAPGTPLIVGDPPTVGTLLPGQKHYYHFEVKSPGRYVMETYGAQALILSLVRLSSGCMTTLVTDDLHSGVGPNAKIVVPGPQLKKSLARGLYFLVVKHLLAEGFGAYHIGITRV